jgi:hypothetical protein
MSCGNTFHLRAFALGLPVGETLVLLVHVLHIPVGLFDTTGRYVITGILEIDTRSVIILGIDTRFVISPY